LDHLTAPLCTWFENLIFARGTMSGVLEDRNVLNLVDRVSPLLSTAVIK